MLRCGDTFLIPKKVDQVEHLWIILTEPDPRTREAACVNISTLRDSSEKTVILRVGDHKFVRHDSVIFYADARILDLSKVEELLNKPQGLFVCSIHDPCSPDLLKKVQEGLLKSRRVKKEIKEFCRIRWVTSLNS